MRRQKDKLCSFCLIRDAYLRETGDFWRGDPNKKLIFIFKKAPKKRVPIFVIDFQNKPKVAYDERRWQLCM